MMIELVMYGMIPSAKTAKFVSAPPENSWKNASTPPCSACASSVFSALMSIPGTGTWEPSR